MQGLNIVSFAEKNSNHTPIPVNIVPVSATMMITKHLLKNVKDATQLSSQTKYIVIYINPNVNRKKNIFVKNAELSYQKQKDIAVYAHHNENIKGFALSAVKL